MKANGAQARPESVLVLGSGALQIGQAGEFDYSGSQALKALREDGVRTVLMNPNIATVQTSEGLADVVYFLPVDPHFVEQVIIAERIDGIVLGFGGQTALNCGLELDARGVLARHGVRVLGTQVDSIRYAEDRKLFNEKLAEIDVMVARSKAATTREEALIAAHEIGLPVILRAAFSLGGRGSSIVRQSSELEAAIERAFVGGSQVLVEECLSGWKEIEYEVLRDAADNCITVCNMENVDPMGIHTGESIVVAPSQTLDDREYQMLREVAMRTVRHLGIVGECNIQYALDPTSRDYRVIEVNPRLSRSSALASKATGYPLAYVAAKVALGYTLPELQNAVTGTSAFFEPALDYLVCKVPRWDFDKFGGVDDRIGTEMKSVGEVMAIGRSFPEVLQKALRMLEVGVAGLDGSAFSFEDLRSELSHPSPRRIFAIAHAFEEGMSVEEVWSLTSIDRFFLSQIEDIVTAGRALGALRGAAALTRDTLLTAKRLGMSDRTIAERIGVVEADVRAARHSLDVRPRIARIDTMAAEYPARTNYLYTSYMVSQSEALTSAAEVPARERILVLGSGPYRIGSSVEFDWCCVNAATTARELGYETLLLNCNPETVSTDFDMCDKLFFDEISMETVMELCELTRPFGVIVSMGGQTPNNLALKLAAAGVNILGTAATSIDRAEDRNKFSALCDELEIDQPRWSVAVSAADLGDVVTRLGGYPVLIRPSYVLSGAAMRVAHNEGELRAYLERATILSPEHPVVISKFETHARELEVDAVADHGKIVHWAVTEHVENAGVHSGDATLVLPPQQLYLETIQRARKTAARLAQELQVTGPFNLQILARHNELKVIELNLRASRSFPFVSKVIGTNFIREATCIMLGRHDALAARGQSPIELPYVAVKTPQFSFRRLSGADPVTGVEMVSTGEVACFGDDFEEALLKAMLATGFRFPEKGVLLSLGPVGDKYRFVEEAQQLVDLGLPLFATPGTADLLVGQGIRCHKLEKRTGTTGRPMVEGQGIVWPSAVERMRAGEIDLVINVPREYDEKGRPDGFLIRRAAVDLDIPLVTDLSLARRLVRAMGRYKKQDLKVRPWASYVRRAQ